ncbi:uncharacterized protein N7487_009581 [Penicillium crustosum]|uniref:uncharacterized protein n=1 Tax=Penicillium crustosum TaxID=36656 RepID=UPI0023992774|nr:uncharacterized protein N7487_009581 [Penicillium crustosum]KAJ5395278.1 hypothetical protein N7487_009581 [Penicillium crustosum]
MRAIPAYLQPYIRWLKLNFPNRLKERAKTKTYNSEDSLVVTHPTTNSPACGLSTAERTGSPVFHTLWSYFMVKDHELIDWQWLGC